MRPTDEELMSAYVAGDARAFEKLFARLAPRVHAFFRRYYGRVSEWMIRIVLGLLWSAALCTAWTVGSVVTRSTRARIMRRARKNCVRFAFSGASTSEIFAQLITGA